MKNLRNILFSFKKEGSFANNISYYTLYFFINILIQFLFTPIISRVFSAEAYGMFCLVASLATYTSLIYTLQMEPLIVMQKDEEKAVNIARAIFTVSQLFTIITYTILAVVLVVNYTTGAKTRFSNIYLILSPILALMLAGYNVYGKVATRYKLYKNIFKVMWPLVLGTKVVTIGWGKLISGNFLGLFFGEFLFRLFAVILGFRYVIGKSISKYLAPLSIERTISILRENARFISYQVPQNLIALLCTQLPVYCIAIYYDEYTIGQFAFANALFEIPVKLISYSLSTVFFQKASEVLNGGGNLFNYAMQMLVGLFFLGLLPFVFLFFYSEFIFVTFFGSQWLLASKIAVVLMPFFYARFVCEPFQTLFQLLGKQKVQLIGTVIYFVISATFLFFSMEWEMEILKIFSYLCFINFFYFVSQTAFLFYYVKNHTVVKAS